MPRRSHPSQTAAVDPNSDSDASPLLSSLVFRRTVETDDEEIGSDHVKKRGYRYVYLYRYGHLGGIEIETGKDGKGGSDGHGKREDVGMKKLSAREQNTSMKLKKDKTQREKKSHERRLGEDEEAELHAERKKVKQGNEWIVLDTGTDLSYSSLLRPSTLPYPDVVKLCLRLTSVLYSFSSIDTDSNSNAFPQPSIAMAGQIYTSAVGLVSVF